MYKQSLTKNLTYTKKEPTTCVWPTIEEAVEKIKEEVA